jgi:amidophosphoribosyltransferase
MPSRKELVAYGRDHKAIASAIGADLVIFQSLSDLVDSVRQFNPAITNFDCSVFTGDYVTGGVTEEYLQHLEDQRSDNMRAGSMFMDTGDSAEKDRGGVNNSCGTVQESPSSPVIKADDTVGLHNTFNGQ